MHETTRDMEFTVLCPFGGSGGGALGFQQAEARLFDRAARFRALAQAELEAFALSCGDVWVSPEEVRAC